eukprot:GDKJ01029366.1.p1 GENE.GDKJ01029366.1~~GDKJ01029366.1.p1  ORF type:complete len:297 (-),score=49.79 GDKJ01029366.1:300-1190(-)
MSNEPSIATKFLIAGFSNCCAGFVTNPLDVVKVRLQADGAHYRGFFDCVKTIALSEGPIGFFRGVVPSLAREATYSTLRLGLYEPVRNHYLEYYNDFRGTNETRPPMIVAMLAGATAGCIGSAIASPTDLIKIRIQTASLTSKEIPTMREVFSSVVNSPQGVFGLWRGVGANIQRAALLTGCQVGFYDKIKNKVRDVLLPLVGGKEGLGLFASSAFAASFFTAVITSPVDVIRTRMMSKGSQYSSTVDCFSKTIRDEGLKGIYRGFMPNWLRLAPHSMVCFSVYESLRRIVGMKSL